MDRVLEDVTRKETGGAHGGRPGAGIGCGHPGATDESNSGNGSGSERLREA
jgi:hypothetical protein